MHQEDPQLSDRFTDLEEICNIFRKILFCTRRNPERHFQVQRKVLRVECVGPSTERRLGVSSGCRVRKYPSDTDSKVGYSDQDLVKARRLLIPPAKTCGQMVVSNLEMLAHYQLERDVCGLARYNKKLRLDYLNPDRST